MSEEKIKKLSDELTELQEQLSGLKNSKLPKKTKKTIITTERFIFGIIILGLIVFFVASTGILGKINPWKKFEFNWENSTTKNFENLEITPYCYHKGDKVDGEEIGIFDLAESEGIMANKIRDFSFCVDINQEIVEGEPTIVYSVIKFTDESDASAHLEKIKSQIIVGASDNILSSFYMVEGENQIIYVGEGGGREVGFLRHIYFWNKDKYIFEIFGTEPFKTKKLTQFIVEQYTNEPETSLEKTKDIFTLSCGDGICSESIEDCNSCVKDCGCFSGKECIKGDSGTYYSCKDSEGQYCSSNYDCASKYCVHNYCRDKGTYCGDSYCDNEEYYDSVTGEYVSGENCGSCLQDCKVEYNQQCVNGEAKTSNEYSCSYDTECISGNCVHNKCRSGYTYCGDSYCDWPEDSDSCSLDC